MSFPETGRMAVQLRVKVARWFPWISFARIVWPPINGSAFLEITKTLIDKNVHFFGSLRKGCLFSPHPFALAYISVFDSHANTVRAARFLCRDVREESLYSSLMANWKRCQFSILAPNDSFIKKPMYRKDWNTLVVLFSFQIYPDWYDVIPCDRMPSLLPIFSIYFFIPKNGSYNA